MIRQNSLSSSVADPLSGTLGELLSSRFIQQDLCIRRPQFTSILKQLSCYTFMQQRNRTRAAGKPEKHVKSDL